VVRVEKVRVSSSLQHTSTISITIAKINGGPRPSSARCRLNCRRLFENSCVHSLRGCFSLFSSHMPGLYLCLWLPLKSHIPY
jgi:hypothetical protein